jgi:hypothetical protein
MLKPIFEGELNIFLKAPATDLVAGTLVKLNGDAFAVAVAGDDVYGVLAQNVQARNVNNFKLDSVTHVAYYGEKAGIYFQGGQYYTDNTATAVTAGVKLYAGAGGKFTTAVPGTGNVKHVAVAETAGAAGAKIRIRLVGNLAN